MNIDNLSKQTDELSQKHQQLRTPLNHIIDYIDLVLEDTAIADLQNFSADLQEIRAASVQALNYLDIVFAPSSGTAIDLTQLRPLLAIPLKLIFERVKKLQGIIASLEHKELNLDLEKIRDHADKVRVIAANESATALAAQPTTNVLHYIPPTPGKSFTGTILVADDTDIIREMLCRRLERSGHKVKVAEDGLQVLELLKQEKFDLIPIPSPK